MAAIQRQANPKHGDAIATVISEGTQVVGRVDGREDLRIQGYVEGTVNLSETLVIDNGGVVVGGVRVRELVVHGILVGDAVASGRIVLHPTARVVGDLQAPRIVVQPGAALRGQLSMGETESENPQEASGGGRQGMGRWRTSSRVAAPAVAPRAPARPVRVTRSAAARPSGILARRTPEPVAEPGPRIPPQRARPSVRESIREQIRERAPAPVEVDDEAEALEAEDHDLDHDGEQEALDLEVDDGIDVDDGTITTSNGKKQAARPRVPARGKHSVEG
ncbi:MAG: polymer-forming cytoskeletal protein [Nannocystaceae bacterium]